MNSEFDCLITAKNKACVQDLVFGVIDMAGVLHSLRSCLTVTLEFIKLIITYIQRKSMRFFGEF